jgi:enolase
MIKDIKAKQILDSRGNPTVSVSMSDGDNVVTASVPSGASTGTYEAVELRDGGEKYSGKGVLEAADNVENIIAPALENKDPANQEEIDKIMIDLDGTKDKSKLGANAILGVSLAAARLAALQSKIPLYKHLSSLAEVKITRAVPYLYMNFINGGEHANSSLSFQEYHVVPMVETIDEALLIGHEFQKELKKVLIAKYGAISSNIGDEGGFVPEIKDPEEPLRVMMETLESLGLADKAKLAMDVAASSFHNYDNDKYMISDESTISSDELLAVYEKMIKEYPILSIEDPFHEEDFKYFGKLLEKGTIVVGDDLTVTNTERLQKAIDTKSINAIIIKPNQIGTLTETIQAIKLAVDNDIKPIVSHRSGETKDDFIADLAFAFGVFGIKAGALQRGERIAKYNRLKEINGNI